MHIQNKSKSSRATDISDRCNYFFTALIFAFFSLLIGTKQHFGAPISCLIDQHYSGKVMLSMHFIFGIVNLVLSTKSYFDRKTKVYKLNELKNSYSGLDSWIGYVHDYCFISERYSLTKPEYEDTNVAAFDSTVGKKYENYYQWVPFLLAAQALAFHVPHCLWRWLQKLSNLDMAVVIEEAVRVHDMVADERSKVVKDLVRYLEQCSNNPIRHSLFMNFTHITRAGWYSSLVYTLQKLSNVANTALQLLIVNIFVGDGTLLWGYQLIKDLIWGRDWTHTGHFPRVVYCDYKKYELANVQQKTVQCALSINVLNEKVFALISAWLMVLFVINVISAFHVISALSVPVFRKRSVLNYLKAFAFPEDLFGDFFFDNGGKLHGKVKSEVCLSTEASSSFHSKVRRRLCASADCNDSEDIENDKIEGHKTTVQNEQLVMIADTRLQHISEKNDDLVYNFISEVVHPDGILLLRFLRAHVGGMVTSDIVFVLWTDYLKAKHSKKLLYSSKIVGGLTSGELDTMF
ncbi:unnamed protein product [Thelazia callipaeda]|uniref:Innexin n=1 Tax=Thelazia callipaeda TaxID=103827 RepID=A0A0N5D6Z7_THECL|nr:unnamed protein product [Thelazia callipaeda]